MWELPLFLHTVYPALAVAPSLSCPCAHFFPRPPPYFFVTLYAVAYQPADIECHPCKCQQVNAFVCTWLRYSTVRMEYGSERQ